ncbi:hypothetical protein DFH08DRAFT_945218 [Mycena albidolilacea]|uniref:F-box domain-containing protein n=1 Tax=Mycena albidolilacea TaxID=1033008 RepID=A0AAD6Z1S5_9AGAR|nr:hypothetical protein DFH08DRAFT_945218 [Mycena albidolilacea]
MLLAVPHATTEDDIYEGFFILTKGWSNFILAVRLTRAIPGTTVLPDKYIFTRHGEAMYPDPDKFNPERFLNADEFEEQRFSTTPSDLQPRKSRRKRNGETRKDMTVEAFEFGVQKSASSCLSSEGCLPGPPIVPLEIQFLILDQIHGTFKIAAPQDVRKELGRLALICSAWAEHAQSLLFRRLFIVDSNVLAARFMSLLRSSAHLGHYTTFLSMQPAAALQYPDLPIFLPNLRTVIMSSSTLEPVGASARPWLGSHELVLLSSRHHSPHPVVAQLALHDLTVDRLSVTLLAADDWDASACNSLLCKIGPRLQDLELVIDLPENWIPVWILEVGICIRPCIALRSLTLGLCSSAGSAKTMRSNLISILNQISVPTLTTLVFVPLHELPWDEIDSILARLDPRLECVLIRVLPADGPDLRFDEFAEFLKEQMEKPRQAGSVAFFFTLLDIQARFFGNLNQLPATGNLAICGVTEEKEV